MNPEVPIFVRVCFCGHPMSAITPVALDEAHDDYDVAVHQMPASRKPS